MSQAQPMKAYTPAAKVTPPFNPLPCNNTGYAEGNLANSANRAAMTIAVSAGIPSKRRRAESPLPELLEAQAGN